MKFDSSYLWSPKYAKWIILSLLLLFSLLIMLEVVSLFTFRHGLKPAASDIQTVAAPVKERLRIENVDTELFGQYIPPNMTSADVKESKLNLDIVSIMFSNDPNKSSVVIRASDGEELYYRIGDTLPGRVVIKSIKADGVLVEHNGALESLRLPEDTLNFEPAPTISNED